MTRSSACLCSIVAGTIYPTYASYKAVHSHANIQKDRWLKYWAVVGALSLTEKLLDKYLDL